MKTERQNIVEHVVEMLNKQTANCCEAIDDSRVRIGGIAFYCDIKGSVSNANSNIVLQQALAKMNQIESPYLLAVKSIYPATMEDFANQGINVIDGAGNCIIRQGELFIKVKGNRNEMLNSVADRAFREAGIRLIFNFLQQPENINLSYRSLKEKTGVSLGTIKAVVEDLTNRKFILKTEKGRFLKNRRKLLELWIEAYNSRLKPKLLSGQMTFRSVEKRDRWREMELPAGMLWGGEAAAHIKDGYLYPGSFEIYSDFFANKLLQTGFVEPSDNGEIKIYRKFWNDVAENQIIPAVLIYADLMGNGNGRCLEAAQKIYDDELSYFE
jgi:hypothetical protein